MHATHTYYKKYYYAKFLYQRCVSVQCNWQLPTTWISHIVTALSMLSAMWLSQDTRMSPLCGHWITLEHSFLSHSSAHETDDSPSYTVTWNFASPPACKHKLKQTLQQERQYAQKLVVKARVKIFWQSQLSNAARTTVSGLRRDQATFFVCGLRNSTL